ncbi:MAG: hypothetical protein R3D68_01470 [Hyphomicrobiaceae bacterium]
MRFLVCGAAFASALVGLAVYGTAAEAAGLDGLHGKVTEGNQLCMADHFHYGNGGEWNSRDKAVAAAARSWASLVVLEYGREWGEFARAGSQEMKCTPTDDDRGGILWNCESKARPCRPLTAADFGVPGQPHVASVAPQPRWHRPRHRRGVARYQAMPRSHAGRPRHHHAHPGRELIWPGDAR